MKHPDLILEREVTKPIRNYLKKKGIYCWKNWSGGRYAKADVADLLCVMPVRVQDLIDNDIEEVGIFMAIECKRPGKHPTDGQYEWGEKIRKAKGVWYWADCIETVVKKVNNLRRLFFEE